MLGRCIRGQVSKRSAGGHCPRRLLQLVSCHQTKELLITNSWTAKGLANERRDGVTVFAERGSRVPVQIKRSFGPVFVWGSQLGQRSSPSRDQDLEDLSRASAAFINKLVGGRRRCTVQQWITVKGKEVLEEVSGRIQIICSCFVRISYCMYDTFIKSAPYIKPYLVCLIHVMYKSVGLVGTELRLHLC